jgi:hypothetical protein
MGNFSLFVQSVKCVSSQEFFGDELFCFGFGISNKGTRFSIPPTKLGDYGDGDSKNFSPELNLVNLELNSSDTFVAVCMWFFEEDAGDLGEGADKLKTAFEKSIDDYIKENRRSGLEKEALYLYSFAQSMLKMEISANELAEDFFDSDDVASLHIFRNHTPTNVLFPQQNYTMGFPVTSGASSGMYEVTFFYSLEEDVPGLDPA